MSMDWFSEELFLSFVWVKPSSPLCIYGMPGPAPCARNLVVKADVHRPCSLGLPAQILPPWAGSLDVCLQEAIMVSSSSCWTEDHMAQPLSLRSLCWEGIAYHFSCLLSFQLSILTWKKNCFLQFWSMANMSVKTTLSLPPQLYPFNVFVVMGSAFSLYEAEDR